MLCYHPGDDSVTHTVAIDGGRGGTGNIVFTTYSLEVGSCKAAVETSGVIELWTLLILSRRHFLIKCSPGFVADGGVGHLVPAVFLRVLVYMYLFFVRVLVRKSLWLTGVVIRVRDVTFWEHGCR